MTPKTVAEIERLRRKQMNTGGDTTVTTEEVVAA